MIISCLSINLAVYATSIDDSSVFIKQTESDWCTYASATNMIRRRALLDGNGNWSSYTDSNLRSAARTSGGGMSNSFSYAGYGVTAENWKNKSTEQKKSSLISLLSSHPEGVVIYTFDGTYTHAILACNYTNGTFYVNDPAKKKSSGIIQLTEAQFNGSSQDDRIGWIKKVWYISSGAGTGGTYTPTPTPTPSTPAGISLSSSTINLDYPNSTSQTITVTATGDLPSKYKFEISINSGLNHNWASSWSGSSINLTVSANQNSPSTSTATIYLKDSSNDSVCDSVNFIINVSKPVVKENVNVYFELNGGENGPLTRTVMQQSSFVVPFQNPYRLGYTFLGWDIDYSSNNPKYKAGDTINIGDSNLVLYAVWDETGIPFSLELDCHTIHDDTFEEVKYNIDGDRFWVDDIVFHCDKNIYCNWGVTENEDGCFSIILHIKRWGDITSNKFSFDVVNEDGIVLFTDTLSVFETYKNTEDELFSDRNPSGISVYLNGEKMSFDVQPQIINSRTMVPMRKIFESLGTVVGWNNNTQTAISVRKGDVVSVGIGGHYLTVNGEQKLLDSPPVVISGRTLGSYAPASANSMLSSINSFFMYMEWYDCKVKTFKIQKQIFANKEKELTKAEYERLLKAAKKKNNEKLYLLMQTICSTGIRVSELRFITKEAVITGQASINCKGKMRVVILPEKLCVALRRYAKEQKITSGSIFVSKNRKPLDRSNIWKLLKGLCESAGVSKDKVFPHNLRHLFARTYYSIEKDVVRLADILGHSSVNTTRIYTMETGEVHRKQIQRLGLLLC